MEIYKVYILQTQKTNEVIDIFMSLKDAKQAQTLLYSIDKVDTWVERAHLHGDINDLEEKIIGEVVDGEQ